MENNVDPSLLFLEAPEHPLTPFFKPKSVAVIGATETAHSVGRTLLHNLITGAYSGKVYPVNPKYQELMGHKCYPTITAAPSTDLVVIVTPAKTVPRLIDECVAAKIKAAIIISAGFKELGEEGAKLEEDVIARAKKGGMRIVGPNCLGIMNPLFNFNATFAASMALKGKTAFISQSGAMCTAVLDWSLKQKIGFSAFVSIGSMADINWGDLIDYLGSDPGTTSILIYMETIGDAKAFLSAARGVVLSKPIIVIKAGRTQEAAKAAASHTGSLAGSDEVFDTAMKRVGVLRVDTIAELFDMAEVLAKQPMPQGPQLTILTNAGGPAVLATDATVRFGAKMAQLAPKTIEALNAILPSAWSHGNPVDLLGDASPQRYSEALEIVAQDPHTHGILVILSPQDMTDVVGTAEALTPYQNKGDKPILASWMGGKVIEKGLRVLNEANIPAFIYPDSASKTFAMMWQQKEALAALYETPLLREGKDALSTQNRQKAEQIIQKALREGRDLLTEMESKEVLHCFHIPTVQTVIAASKAEAVEAAQKIGFPAVLKLHSETITHKTDVGGVKLNLKNRDEVAQAFEEIKASVTAKAGAEHFQGVTVQKMISLKGYELILGSSIDVQFGPVILFGLGGQLVEVFKDRALALPPLSSTLARQTMRQTKIFEALQGVRGMAGVDVEKLEALLIAFSQMILRLPRIKECDINPLLASPTELIALDARIVLHPLSVPDDALPKPAIRPYPIEYVSKLRSKKGLSLIVRPIRAEDEPLIKRFHEELSESTIYARYFKKMPLESRVAHDRLMRVCHTDYSREIALVVQSESEATIYAVSRLIKLQDPREAQLRIVVSDKVQGQGIGEQLVDEVVRVAKLEGIKTLHAEVLKENERMLKILEKKGFHMTPHAQNSAILHGQRSL